ncbi:MAG: hypothetical protein PHS37_01585, partial [Candidatus Omnitrophica bacterium]|nr:hypothetical protein [Candidatus Omnitrophota bacterium]
MCNRSYKAYVSLIALLLTITFVTQDIVWANPDCIETPRPADSLAVWSRMSDPFFNLEHQFMKLWACGINIRERDVPLPINLSRLGQRGILQFQNKYPEGDQVVVPIDLFEAGDTGNDKPVKKYEAVIGPECRVAIREAGEPPVTSEQKPPVPAAKPALPGVNDGRADEEKFPVAYPTIYDINALLLRDFIHADTHPSMPLSGHDFDESARVAQEIIARGAKKVVVVGDSLNVLPIYLALAGVEVTYVDQSPQTCKEVRDQFEYIQRAFKSEGFAAVYRFTVIHSNIGSFDPERHGLIPGTIDVVTLIDLAQDPVGDPKGWFKTARRLLKDGGIIVTDETDWTGTADVKRPIMEIFREVFPDAVKVFEQDIIGRYGKWDRRSHNGMYALPGDVHAGDPVPDIGSKKGGQRKGEGAADSYETLERKIGLILQTQAARFIWMKDIVTRIIGSLPRHGYIDVSDIKTDLLLTCLSAAREADLDVDGLENFIDGLINKLVETGAVPIAAQTPETAVPHVTVSRDDMQFAFGEDYQAMLLHWKERLLDWSYVRVNDRNLVEPIGFPGHWLLRTGSSRDLPEYKRLRLLKSFGLSLGGLFSIEDNYFEVILTDRAPGKGVAGDTNVRTEFFDTVIDESGIIKIYVKADFAEMNFLAQRRYCYEYFRRLNNFRGSLSKAYGASVESMVTQVPDKKVVFLHEVDSKSGGLLSIPPAYLYLAAELAKQHIKVEFQSVLDGGTLLSGMWGRGAIPTIESLAQRQDIGLFAVLNVTEATYGDYRRMVGRLSRESKVPIIAGGPFFSLIPEYAVTHLPGVDAALRGEGEECIVPMVQALLGTDKGVDPGLEAVHILRRMNGLVSFQGKVTICNNIHRQRMIRDLNTVALAESDFSFLDARSLMVPLQITVTRGCPRRCVWCAHPHRKAHRRMDVDIIIKMLTAYKKRLAVLARKQSGPQKKKQALTMHFSDDDLFLNKKEGISLLDRFGQTGLTISSIQTSMDALLTDTRDADGNREVDMSVLNSLVRNRDIFINGVPSMLVGTDAFIDAVISRHKKGVIKGNETEGYTNQEIMKVIEACERMGIYNQHYWIMTDIETSWEEFFEHFSTIIALTSGRKYFSIALPPNVAVMSSYLTDSYKRIIEQGRQDRLVTKLATVNPEFGELSYPIIIADLPYKFGPREVIEKLINVEFHELFEKIGEEAEEEGVSDEVIMRRVLKGMKTLLIERGLLHPEPLIQSAPHDRSNRKAFTLQEIPAALVVAALVTLFIASAACGLYFSGPTEFLRLWLYYASGLLPKEFLLLTGVLAGMAVIQYPESTDFNREPDIIIQSDD